MSQQIGWGILGLGKIARAFVIGVQQSGNGKVVAVGSRSHERAEIFARRFGLCGVTCHGSYDALLADPDVQAVYIATPHPMHARWAVAAAQAGKHIVCEKPAGINHAEAKSMVESARRRGVFFMEAFKDRCHPQTHKLLSLVRDSAIGQVRMIRCEFGYGGGDEIDPRSRVFDPDLGGGGILDVGCYAVAFVRLIAGTASGLPFLNPDKVVAVGRIGQTAVDEWTVACLHFPNDIVAQVATAVRVPLQNTATIVGSLGTITLPDPWINHPDNPTPGQILLRRGSDEQLIEVPAERTSYGYEAMVAADAILRGLLEAPAPAMTPSDTVGQMQTLDAWRKQINLRYPGESVT